MTHKNLRLFRLVAVMAAVLISASCAKKVARVTPPTVPPSPPAAPTVTLTAVPDVIQAGQSATLTWQTQNAENQTIEGLGAVQPSGSRGVSPSASRTYTLVATGPGGTQEATARVTVNPAAAKTIYPDEESLFAQSVKDVFFDYNKYDIRPDEVLVTDKDGQFLSQHPGIRIEIEGHCDDRGSDEYNLALGESRANSLKESLEKEGISADRISTLSYGKEKPFCSDDDEQCWQQNRRDHFVLQR